MGHNSVVSSYPKSIGIPWVDGLSTGPFGFGASQKNCGREREENGEKSKTSFDVPRSSVSWNSSSQELKFIYSMRATRVYKEKRDFN